MTTLDCVDMTADDTVYGQSTTDYTIARSTANNRFHNIAIPEWLGVGRSMYVRIYRSFLKFNTTTLPGDAIISQVNMKLVCVSDTSTANFDVDIVKYNWSAYDPLTNANMETPFDGCLSATKDVTWRNTNGMSLNTVYTSPNMDVDWPTREGYTYYGIRSYSDYANPTNPPTSDEFIYLAAQDHATEAYRPILEIVYEHGGNMFQVIFTD
jgi:hypothetical protein